MTRLLQLVLLFVAVRTADAEPFLSSELIGAFQNAPVIRAQLIDPMPFTPTFRPESFQFQTEIALTSRERERLLSTLRAAETIDPITRLKECRYLPGISFTITTGDRSHSAILCLNCDVWALDAANPQPTFGEELHAEFNAPRRLTRFGDSRPQREALWGLFNDLRARIVAQSERGAVEPPHHKKNAP